MPDLPPIKINLEGGELVERQLAQIGQAGQKAFGDIQNAADQINLDSATNQFEDLANTGVSAFAKIKLAAQGAVALEGIVQGLQKIQGAFDALGNAAEKLAIRMTKHMGAIGVVARALGPVGIAVGALGGAFVKFGDSTADAIDGLTSKAAKLNLTAQQFDQLQTALRRAGIAGDTIAPGLAKLKETLAEDFFPRDVVTGFQDFIAELEKMPDGVKRTQLAMKTLGEDFGAQIIAGLQTGTISAQTFRDKLAAITPVTQQQIIDAANYEIALNQMKAAWTELTQVIVPITTPVFKFLTEQITIFKKDLQALRLEIAFAKAIWDVFKAGIAGQDVGEAARKAAQEYKDLERQLTQTGKAGSDAGQQTASGMGTATQAAVQTTQALTETGLAGEQAGQRASASMNALTASMFAGIRVVLEYQDALRRLAWYQNLPRPTSVLQGLRPDPIGFAGGGMIGGIGSGTSDSNLAWVSRGEHIMPARAVSQPGVLSFLEALRRTGGDLRSVLDGLGRFALGGLVPRGSIPAYATGGPIGGMSHVTIQFPGLPPIIGLRASSGVVADLQKAAALAQVRSGGRKPSRYS